MGKTLYAYDDRIWEPVYEFEYTGEPREFTIDPGEYLFICNGAQGGNGNTSTEYWCWNYGAAAYGIFETDQTETLYAVVGGEGGALNGSTPGEGGYNGGGRGGYYPNSSNAAGSGGGGASDIRLTLDEDLVVHPQRSDIPDDYEECWYMRRNWKDQGCFNTGYRLSNNTRVELDLKIHGFSVTNGGNWCCICGQRSGNNSGDQFIVGSKYNGNIGACAMYRSTNTNTPKVPSGPNKLFPFDERFSMTITTARVSWISESGETNSIDDIPVMTTNPANQDFVLFAYMNNGSPYYDEQFGMRVYECKIYEDDVLMHDFVPVIRKSDSAAGFFDTVNQEFKDIIGTLHAIRYEKPTKSLLSRILVAAGGGGDCNYTSNNQSFFKFAFGGGETGTAIASAREAKSSFYLWATQNDGPFERSFGRGRDGNVLSGSYSSYSAFGSGGGGGGWFGGTSVWNHAGAYATQPGAGGSSYALSSESYKPYGYIPTSHYYLKKTKLIPCQSEHNGSIKILRVAKLLHSEDKIIVPFQGKETKLKLFPGTYNIKCYGAEGASDPRSVDTNGYRHNGGYSEGSLTLKDLHEIYGVVGGSGLWYDYFTYQQKPYLWNKYPSFNGGGITQRTSGWLQPFCGGGATDLRLTMDQTPVHPTEPDPDTRDDIPEGYVQLKAIYMGNSYINSGYNVNENTEIKIDVSISGTDGSYRELFGVEPSLVFYTRASGQSAFVVNSDTIFGDLIPTNTRLTVETGSNWLKWTTDISEYTYTATGTSVSSSAQELYFNTMSRSGAPVDYALATWYSIKIYESGVLVHDFVPVHRTDLNLTGFYDVIGDMFAQCQGSDFSEVPLADITYPSKTLMSRFIVAGGGGGRGYSSGYGGKGGGSTGGTQVNGNGVTGGPGTQTSSPSVSGHPESDGGFGYGGSGYVINNGRGGSGGGGWFGGSGSHPNGRNQDDIKGGNGGSGYVLTEDSYKPDYYIPDEEFYLEDASTTLGGNTLIPNMSRIEIDVVSAFCTKLMIYDSDGYKAYDVNSNVWSVVTSGPITPELIEEYGIYQIQSLNGVRNEFDVVMDDPDDIVSGIDIEYFPLPQEISFLVPKRNHYNREVIDASYDDTIYDMKTTFRKYDNEYNAYVVSIEKKMESDEIFKLYSINLFAN